MTIPLMVLAVSLIMLYLGGENLIRGAAALATRFNVSPLAIGLTVVAFGTSLPELVVSLDAARSGAHAVAVANVVGSNIANIALILGLAALIRSATVQARLLRIDMPILVGTSLFLVWALSDGRASRSEGALLLAALVVYTIFTFWMSRGESAEVREQFAAAAPAAQLGLWKCIGLVAIGLSLLIGGGRLFVDAAVKLAVALGMSQVVIGLTIVAIGTSLPELVTSVLASLRGQGDIAIGNVVGSNLFNILGILGATALLQPLDASSLTRVDLGTMLALSILLAIFLTTARKLTRIEGAVLFALYVAYTAWLVAG